MPSKSIYHSISRSRFWTASCSQACVLHTSADAPTPPRRSDSSLTCGSSRAANETAGDVKQLAIDLVKAGATGKDAEALMRRHISGPIMSYYELDKLRRYVDGTIRNLMLREGMSDV